MQEVRLNYSSLVKIKNFLFRILDSCKYLQLLDVSFCENLDDVTIMIWRNEYPNVCIKRSEVPNDG